MSDRFGDYGLVGLVIWRFENDSLTVETFLLSCRALGRGVEHRILAHLGNVAKARGAAYVDVHFVPSAKNKPALDFLESVGGPFRQALNGGYVFRFPAEVAAEIAFNPQNAAVDSLALTSPGKPAAQTDTRSTFARWRWIALEANQVNQIQALIEAKAGVRKSSGLASAAPNTDVERELCHIWQELLRIERVGIRDNFFELGGHSLLAVRLFAQIEKRLKVKLPIVTIFQSPTVEQLAKAIDQQSSQPPDAGLLPIQSEGDRPPLFLVHGAGGDVLWGYANLAHHTDRDQPIYGIQACGAEDFRRSKKWPRITWKRCARFSRPGRIISAAIASAETSPRKWRVNWKRRAKASRCWRCWIALRPTAAMKRSTGGGPRWLWISRGM